MVQDNRVHIGPKMEIRVVTLGLDGAGKTTILFKLKQDEFMQPIPTIGKRKRRGENKKSIPEVVLSLMCPPLSVQASTWRRWSTRT